MKPVAIIVAFGLLSACEGIIDLRPVMSGAAPAPTPAVAPAPAPTAAPILTAKERLARAIEGQGCELNANTVSAIMTAATINQDELKTLIPQLQAEGRAEVKNGGAIRVISNKCI